MSKVTVQMNTEDYNEVCSQIEESYCLKLNAKQMKKILVKRPELLIDVARNLNMDTSVEEEIVDEIACGLIGENWPTGGTKHRVAKRFYETFSKAANKAGYKFDLESYV